MKKTRKKRSVIWSMTREELAILFDASSSINDMLMRMGLHGGSHKKLKQRLKEENFDLNIFEEKKSKLKKERVTSFKEFPLDEVMVINSSFARAPLRKRLIKEKVIPYLCEICGMEPMWLGKPLSLILDHKNGIRNDHRKENLRFLCPCCNSQTETFAGRNKQHNYKLCACGKKITSAYERCSKCAMIARRKNRPTKEELKNLLWSKPTTKIAEDYKVTDNAVAKWAKDYGLNKPPRGYWKKHQTEGLMESRLAWDQEL